MTHSCLVIISHTIPKGAVTLGNISCKCNIPRLQIVSHFVVVVVVVVVVVAASVAESRTDSAFRNNCGNDAINFFLALHSVTSTVQCFGRSANQDPYYPLLCPPQSQFCELLAVPLHSVTPLFLLQCYAFKRCQTSCTKNCPV